MELWGAILVTALAITLTSVHPCRMLLRHEACFRDRRVTCQSLPTWTASYSMMKPSASWAKRVMGIAFEMTCAALQIERAHPAAAKAAKRIIELAKDGERNPDRLAGGLSAAVLILHFHRVSLSALR